MSFTSHVNKSPDKADKSHNSNTRQKIISSMSQLVLVPRLKSTNPHVANIAATIPPTMKRYALSSSMSIIPVSIAQPHASQKISTPYLLT